MNSTNLQLLDARRELDLLRREKKLRENNGIAFYEPHPKQDLFHRAANYRRRYVRTGNRFGKSDMGASEDIAWALGERPWYPVGDPARTVGIPKHSTKGCIVVQDWDKAHEIFTNPAPGTSQGKLFQKLPKDSILLTKKGRSGTGIVEIHVKSIHGGVSTIHLETVRSYMQNKMGLESSNWDWIHVDEPCPEGMWIALSRGLIDRGGSAWFTCTPITEPWINDYFIPASRSRATFDTPYINDAYDNPRWVVTGSSRDNPHIKQSNIDEYAAGLSEDERKTRIDGIPANMTGLVYRDFSYDLHVYRSAPHGWTDPAEPPKNYTIRTLIDPHPQIPHAVLHFATAPTGHTFIFNEIFKNGFVSDIVEAINAQTEGYHVEEYIMDPLGFIESPIDGRCMADEFFDAGIPVVPAPKDLAYGILQGQKKWRERDRQGNPTIFVHENCAEFLYEIDRYIWSPNSQDRPVDKDDHMMENYYRGVLSGLTYVDPDSRVPHYKPIQITKESWRSDSSLMSLNTTLPEHKPLTISSRGRYLN